MPIKGTGNGSRYDAGEFFVLCDACHVARFGANSPTPHVAVTLALADGFVMSADRGSSPKFVCQSCATAGYKADSTLCDACGSNDRVTPSRPPRIHALCFECYHTRGVDEVTEMIVKRKAALAPPPMPLKGLTFCFTGKLSDTRDRFWKMTIDHGGIVHDKVSNKHRRTDFLVCGDRTGAVKLAAAATAGVKCINENEFLKMMNPRLVLPVQPDPVMVTVTMPVHVIRPVVIPLPDPAERERQKNEARGAISRAAAAFDTLEEEIRGKA